MSNDEEIGTLIVVVLKARNLNDKHFYKQDVYAQVTLNGVSKRTRIDVKGGQHPVWDEEIRFPVMKNTSSKFRQLEASCWAKEHKDDTLLGETKIDMAKTIKTGEFDEWVPLETNGVARGEIYLEITYYSNGPAPANLAAPATLARRPSKLTPAERMSRPPVTPPKTYASLEPSHPQPGSRTPPKNLPPLPESLTPAVPSTLRPGPARVAPQQQVQPVAQPSRPPGEVPSILRPGKPQSGPNSTHHAHTYSASSSSSSPHFGNTPPPGQVPYNPVSGQPSFAGAHSRNSSNTPPPGQVPYNPVSGQPNFASAHSRSSSHTPPPGQVPYNSVSGQPNFVSAHSRSSSSATPPQDFSYHPILGQGPYDPNSGGPAPAVNAGHNSVPNYTHNYSSVSGDPWGSQSKADAGIALSFPVPSVSSGPGPAAAPASYGSSYYAQTYPPVSVPKLSHTSSYTPQPADLSNSSSDLPDPYLIARYQTPLPLPQGAEPTPNFHTQTPLPLPQGAEPTPTFHTQTPLPLPQGAEPTPTFYTQSSTSVHHHRTLSQELPTLPVPQPVNQPARSHTPIDESRLKVLRQAEEEAARRKAQEERDLELARQLDQELERERAIPVHDVALSNPAVSSKKSASPPRPPRVVESDAAAHRRAQEEKDLELARQLDLELNLNASSTAPNGTSVNNGKSRVGMPGGW